ncbi:hypothetical protein, partial [Metallibacterium sp.]|uniref:hypothetical protein n=1 Tax=Metallibacterium sp. TaxID=2940281 RepID=UPI002601FA19
MSSPSFPSAKTNCLSTRDKNYFIAITYTYDQFAKPGILPRFASKRARQSRTTFVATSTCVLVAAAHPCAGAVLQTA